jgi:hypothetical protein
MTGIEPAPQTKPDDRNRASSSNMMTGIEPAPETKPDDRNRASSSNKT